MRYSTFGDNQGAMLSVRNGDYNVIYSNFFINAGGVRVKHANNTYVYNNYFQNSGDNKKTYPIAWYNLSGIWAPYYAYRNNFVIKYNTIVDSGYISLDSTPKINGEFSNNIFKKAVNANPLVPSGNIFWGNNEGITFLSNLYYGTLTSNTPYSQGTGTKKGPPKDAYCFPTSATCDMLTRYSPCSSSPPPLTHSINLFSQPTPLLLSTNPSQPPLSTPSHPLKPLYQPLLTLSNPSINPRDTLISTNLAGLTNADPQLVWSSGLGYYVPNAGSSPAVGTATAGAGQANFDIPVLNDDPSVSYDITGRLRSLNPTCAAGKCDMGCSQSGLTGRCHQDMFYTPTPCTPANILVNPYLPCCHDTMSPLGTVLNWPRNIFNTGVSYPTSHTTIPVRPSSLPTVSPTTKPSYTPSTSPSISPSTSPSVSPTTGPSFAQTVSPSTEPSTSPSTIPTVTPTVLPSTTAPSAIPTSSPTFAPSRYNIDNVPSQHTLFTHLSIHLLNTPFPHTSNTPSQHTSQYTLSTHLQYTLSTHHTQYTLPTHLQYTLSTHLSTPSHHPSSPTVLDPPSKKQQHVPQ